MKKLLLLIVCAFPMLSFAQLASPIRSIGQSATQILVSNGCVSLTPDSHDFGNQPVNFPSKSGPFYLLNSCNVSLTVSSVNANGVFRNSSLVSRQHQ